MEKIQNMIKYDTTLSEEISHQNYVFLNSKYKSQFEIVDYSKKDQLDYKKEDIYFINCLVSSDMANHFIQLKKQQKINKLIIHNSGNVDFVKIETLNQFDLIYYETLYTYRNSHLRNHVNNLRAFGVNTDIFRCKNLTKKYDYIWVGSINDHLKRFTKISELAQKGSKILMIGNIYTPEDKFKLDNMISQGFEISVKSRCNLDELSYYYNISKCLLLTQPLYGGGERSLLEAKYCGLEIKILDNEKLSELHKEDKKFDIEYYTKQIDKGLDKIINK